MRYNPRMQRRALVRLLSFVLIVAAFVAVVLLVNRLAGPIDWVEVFSSRESLRAFVSQFDPYGPLVFFLIQTAQVIVAPIPGNVTALAGGALFGFWWGFALSTGGLVLGSTIAFALARFYGRPLVERFVPKRIIDKYIDAAANKHFVALFLMFLLPFFPDDALCFIAALSSLRYRVFLLFVIVARPPGMLVTTLVGSGALAIPWWGWVIIVLASAGLFFIGYKKRDALDRLLGISEKP